MDKKVQSLKSFVVSSGFRKYFANTSWLMLEKILRMTVGLFVGVWVARYLGPERYGVLSYSISIVALFSVFATLGLDGIVVRELVQRPEKRDELLGTAFMMKLFGALFVLLILTIIFIVGGKDKQAGLVTLVIAAGLAFQSLNVLQFYFQSKLLSQYFALANIASFTVSSVIKIVLILKHATLFPFAFVIFFDSFVLACGLVYFYRRGLLRLRDWKFSKNLAFALLRESKPLIVSFFTTSIALKIDQIMLKELLDESAIGLYAASLRLTEVWYFLPVVLTTSFFPAIVNTADKKNHAIRVNALASVMVIVSLSISIVLVLFRKKLILFLYGSDYSFASNILFYHAFSLIFVFAVSLRKKVLLVERKTTLRMYYSILTAILMIVSNFVFIKKYGIIGASIAHLFTWSASILIVPLLFGRFSEVALFFRSFNLMSLRQLHGVIMNNKKQEVLRWK